MTWQEILRKIVDFSVDLAWKLLLALLVLVIGNVIIRFVLKRLKNGKLSRKMDPTALTFIHSFAKIGLYLVLGIAVVGILGVETASVITVIASAGAAIALALQGSLSNLAGGLMILIFRPFRSGDFIDVAGESGSVTEVGIFYTVIRTGDNRHITVPNGTAVNSVVVNYSREDKRRVDLILNVAYGTDIEKAKSIVMDIVNKHEKVLQEEGKEPFLRMTEMADSSLNLTLRVWCDADEYWSVKFDLTESINEAFKKNHITIPFPQMEVHVKND